MTSAKKLQLLGGAVLALSLAGCGTRKPKAVEQPVEQIPVPTPAPVEDTTSHWTRPTGDSIREEMRAVWLTTVYGLDWPRDKADTPDGVRNPAVLAAACLAGIQEVYTIGGAQAVAALAPVQATKTYSRVTMTKLAQIERGRLRAGSCMSSARKAVISQPV